MEWRKVFTEPGTLIAILTSSIVGLCVGSAQGLVQHKYGGWSGFFGAIATAMVVSVLVGLSLQEYVHQEALRLALIGASAVIADDIWAGLRAMGRLIREDPLGTVSQFFAALRGNKSPTAPPKEEDKP